MVRPSPHYLDYPHPPHPPSKGDNLTDTPRTWLPTLTELTTHYLREIGFLACLSQFLGATVFWISGFTAIPQINAALGTRAEQNGAYWLPQVVGGTGFVVSSLLFMVEVQERWYIPAPSLLGWHVGFWNLVGAIGFTLCGALGFAVDDGGPVEYALTLATFVGSWAFLVSFLWVCVLCLGLRHADSGGVARLGRRFSGMSRWISIRCWLGMCRFKGEGSLVTSRIRDRMGMYLEGTICFVWSVERQLILVLVISVARAVGDPVIHIFPDPGAVYRGRRSRLRLHRPTAPAPAPRPRCPASFRPGRSV